MMTEKQLVERHVLHNQTMVVSELIRSGVMPDENFSDAWFEVLEWWLITPYLARLLCRKDELVIEDYACHWWGRTTSGQAIYMDSVIADIVQYIQLPF